MSSNDNTFPRRFQISWTGTDEEMEHQRDSGLALAYEAGFRRTDPQTGKRVGSLSPIVREMCLHGEITEIDGVRGVWVPLERASQESNNGSE